MALLDMYIKKGITNQGSTVQFSQTVFFDTVTMTMNLKINSLMN